MVFENQLPLIPRYLRREIEERISYDGKVLIPLCRVRISKLLWTISDRSRLNRSPYAISIPTPTNPTSGRRWITQAAVAGGVCLPLGDITKEWREYERTSTAVLNAYVMRWPPPISTVWINACPKLV
jgi:N-methylhydantoinase A